MTAFPHNKLIDIGDFDRAELRPLLEEVARDDMVRFGLDAPAVSPDADHWASAMMLRTFAAQGLLQPGKVFAGVGAGVSGSTFVLAARGCVTFAVDTYLELSERSDLVPAPMMVRPRQFSYLDYPKGAVLPLHGDPRALDLPSDFFDGVYAPSLLSRYATLDAAAAAAEEIGRILKPGGTASLSASFRLEGPNDQPFPKGGLLFTRELINRYVLRPSGLEPLDPLTDQTSLATYDGQVVLRDFLERAVKSQTLEDKRDTHPNLVMFQDGFLFCTVHLALRKPAAGAAQAHRATRHSQRLEPAVDAGNLAAAGVLTGQIRAWRDRFGREEDMGLKTARDVTLLTSELKEAHACLADITRRNHRSEAGLFRLEDARGPGHPPLSTFDLWREDAGSTIKHQIGVLEAGALRSEGESGALSYGPYAALEIGHYRVQFDLRAVGTPRGRVDLDVSLETGAIVLGAASLAVSDLDQSVVLDINVEQNLAGVEFRVFCSGGADVALASIKTFRRRGL